MKIKIQLSIDVEMDCPNGKVPFPFEELSEIVSDNYFNSKCCGFNVNYGSYKLEEISREVKLKEPK